MTDLTTKETEAEETDDVEVETTTRESYVTCAYFAISSMTELDEGLMTGEDAKRKKRILRKSLRIIDDVISELYDELFEDDEE